MPKTNKREAKTHSIEAAVERYFTFAHHTVINLYSAECLRCGRATAGQEEKVHMWAYNHLNRLHHHLI